MLTSIFSEGLPDMLEVFLSCYWCHMQIIPVIANRRTVANAEVRESRAKTSKLLFIYITAVELLFVLEAGSKIPRPKRPKRRQQPWL